MNCPRCGHEMTLDQHRKIPTMMCYECGYIEGRTYDDNFNADRNTNFKHLKELNFNETVAFLATGLGIKPEELSTWFDQDFVD